MRHSRSRPWLFGLFLLLAGGAASAALVKDEPPARDPVTDTLRTQINEYLTTACRRMDAGLEPRVRARLAPIEADLKARVTDFGDWMFGWSASYDRDRMLFSAGFDAAYNRISLGDWGSVWTAVEQRLTEEVRKSFHQTVIDPVGLETGSQEAWREVVAAFDAEWGRVLDGRDAIVRASLVQASFANARLAPVGSIEPPVLRAAEHSHVIASAAAAPIAGDLDPDDEILARAPRPVVSRVAGFALRRSVGISTFSIAGIVAEATDAGLFAYIPGVMLGYVTAVATALGIDYVITKADEAVNRGEIEANLDQAIGRSFDTVARLWKRQLSDTLAKRCVAARPT